MSKRRMRQSTPSSCRARERPRTRWTPDQLAHCYRFAEIAHGKRLVKDPAAPHGFSYSGAAIPFDPAGVFNMVNNPKTCDLPSGSISLRLSRQFNYSHTCLLNSLHQTFNGAPDHMNAAIGLMYPLKIQAQTLMQTPIFADEPLMSGPSFEYQPTE